MRPRKGLGYGFAAALALSLTCGDAAWAQNATIIDVNVTGCDTAHPGAQRATLAGLLTAAGYTTVTQITTGVVPGSLAGEQQVWDIRCQTVLSAGEITTYTNYLAGGGSLFLMGENTSFGAARDASLISFIATLGGGSLTLTATNNSQTAQPPFTGPTAVTTVNFRAIGGTTTPGTGAFITRDSNNFGGGVVFPPGSLSGAPTGTLMILFDVNFLDNDATHTAGETAIASNMIAYLAAPTPIIPVPPTLILSAVGVATAAALAWRRRRARKTA